MSTLAGEREGSDAPQTATAGSVFRLWLSPAISNTILTVEIPLVAALVARGPRGVESLAAFGVALSWIVVVDSPALALASTAAALGENRLSVRRLRWFATALGLGLAGLLALALLTPLADWLLRDGMGLAEPLVPLARQGLWFFVGAPLAVSWRRCHQGVLIRLQDTPVIAYATGARIVISVSFAAIALSAIALPGVAIGTLALTLGAFGEALILIVWSLRHSSGLPAEGQPPALATLLRFHLPLAGTTLLALLYLPLIPAGIARATQPELSLAAWPVVYGLISLLASPTLELEPITVSFASRLGGRPVTRRFCVALGLALSALMLLVARTPLGGLYFVALSGLSGETARLAADAALIALLIPLLFALRGWLRGLLIAGRRPGVVQLAAGSSVVALLAILAAERALAGLPGLYVGVLAFVLALALETALLWAISRRLGREG